MLSRLYTVWFLTAVRKSFVNLASFCLVVYEPVTVPFVPLSEWSPLSFLGRISFLVWDLGLEPYVSSLYSFSVFGFLGTPLASSLLYSGHLLSFSAFTRSIRSCKLPLALIYDWLCSPTCWRIWVLEKRLGPLLYMSYTDSGAPGKGM